MNKNIALLVADHLVKEQPNQLVEKLALAFEANDSLAEFLAAATIPKVSDEDVVKYADNYYSSKENLVVISYNYRLTNSFQWVCDINCEHNAYYKSEEDMNKKPWSYKDNASDEYAFKGAANSTCTMIIDLQ